MMSKLSHFSYTYLTPIEHVRFVVASTTTINLAMALTITGEDVVVYPWIFSYLICT